MATAVLIGWGAQVIVQLPSIKKKGFKWRAVLNFKDSNIKSAMKMALPVLIASWGQPICVLINTHFAPKLFPGAISALNNANKLYILIVGVLSFAITNYIFPQMSRLDFKSEEFRKIVSKSIKAIIYLISPVMIIMMLFSKPIIAIFYGHGNFNAENVKITATALSWLSIGMVSLGINEILNKAFYSIKNAKTPMIATASGILFNIASICTLDYFGFLSIETLALASSLATVITMIILIIRYRKTQKGIDKRAEA
jgi:putative peptidoglycan lipid II flippase